TTISQNNSAVDTPHATTSPTRNTSGASGGTGFPKNCGNAKMDNVAIPRQAPRVTYIQQRLYPRRTSHRCAGTAPKLPRALISKRAAFSAYFVGARPVQAVGLGRVHLSLQPHNGFQVWSRMISA